jgi:hypothetical protein
VSGEPRDHELSPGKEIDLGKGREVLAPIRYWIRAKSSSGRRLVAYDVLANLDSRLQRKTKGSPPLRVPRKQEAGRRLSQSIRSRKHTDSTTHPVLRWPSFWLGVGRCNAARILKADSEREKERFEAKG